VNQPAKQQHLRPKPLGRAKLELVRPGTPPTALRGDDTAHNPGTRSDLTTQVEKFVDIVRELPPLFEQHYHEIARDQDKIPLDPDWDRYFQLELTGWLVVTTARAGKDLVGYIFNLAGGHLHYRSTPHAEIEMFWLDPAYRGSSFALRWFRENEAALKKLGAKKIAVATKNGYKGGRVGLIFKRLGYLPIETTWAKVL
jgi:GNAT superfamily N-acetyltransferase